MRASSPRRWGAVVAPFSAVSWYASLIPAGVTYYLLMKHWSACRRLGNDFDIALPFGL